MIFQIQHPTQEVTITIHQVQPTIIIAKTWATVRNDSPKSRVDFNEFFNLSNPSLQSRRIRHWTHRFRVTTTVAVIILKAAPLSVPILVLHRA